jgi:hypothetical protein
MEDFEQYKNTQFLASMKPIYHLVAKYMQKSYQ